jgi:hypothetical protein
VREKGDFWQGREIGEFGDVLDERGEGGNRS